MERKKASDYPQELLDLFHEYQHGDINRRDFLDRAKKFAIGGLTAAAIFETLRPNYAWAEQVKKDDPRIKVSYETVASPDGNGSIKGYFARPANISGKLPTVLVIHENRGLNPYVEDVARRFAAANFIASAKWLKTRPESNGKLGAIGFCFGGGIVNQLAVRLGKDLNAGAPFYGRQPGAEDVPKIMAPIQAHYADPKIDTGVGTGIEPFEAALKANGKKYEIFIYTGAQHGFHNDTTPRYDETAAKLATRRYMEFFNKNLG